MATFDQVLAGIDATHQRGFGREGNRKAEGQLEQWWTIEDRARATVQTVLTREKSIKTDGRYTPAGQAEQFLALAQYALEEFGFLGREIDTTREAMARLKAISLDYLVALAKASDKLEVLLRAQEVRAEFRSRPQREKDEAFLAAAQQLDAETMRAFQTGPGGAWVSGEVLSRADALYAERRDREAWNKLQALGVYLDRLVSLAGHIATALLTWRADRAAIAKALAIELPMDPQQQQLAKEAALREQATKGAGRG